MIRRALRRDEGFTLSELLVVMALLGVVLAAAYSLMQVANGAVELSDEQAWISREIGQPLEHAERLFSQQAPPIEDVGRYVCEIRTDQDRDNNYEYHRFEATSTGQLTERVWEQVDSTTPRNVVWSRNNTNLSSGTPLFTYFDQDGNDISNESAVIIKRYAASAVITIVTTHGDREFSDSREVFFRNR